MNKKLITSLLFLVTTPALQAGKYGIYNERSGEVFYITSSTGPTKEYSFMHDQGKNTLPVYSKLTLKQIMIQCKTTGHKEGKAEAEKWEKYLTTAIVAAIAFQGIIYFFGEWIKSNIAKGTKLAKRYYKWIVSSSIIGIAGLGCYRYFLHSAPDKA